MKMQSVVTYVRNIINGFFKEDEAVRTNTKRIRTDEDDFPSFRSPKLLKRSNFPDLMASNDWEKEEKRSKNVRYVPIQIEAGHPSTSTPNEFHAGSHTRTVPLQFVSGNNGPGTPARKPRMHTPLRSIYNAVEEDEPEVTLVRAKPEKSNKPTKVYINLDDYEQEPEKDDVIFVKKVKSPPLEKPCKYFVSKKSNDVLDSSEEPIYYRLKGKATERNNSAQNYDKEPEQDDVIYVSKVISPPPPEKPYKYFVSQNSNVLDTNEDPTYYRLKGKATERSYSPKNYEKFRAPPGITKSYKKPPVPVAQWMQPQKSCKNRFTNLNGNARSTLLELYNLDEKRNYQELIKRVIGTVTPVKISKKVDVINLAEDAASFRMTQRSQKSALNEIKFLERGLQSEKENAASKEYDPITVASINSSDSEAEVIPSESSSSIRISAVNSFRDSLKDRAVTADDWLFKLNSKYKQRKQDKQEKLKDAQLESNIISKINHEQKVANLEHKLKHELSIPESLIEEPQPTVELPKLTPDQEKLVSRALGPGPPNQLLVEKFNLRIHRRDLQTLAGLNWLNDEVINFYMNLLMQRSEERKDLPKVYATNTFFYPKLMQSGQAGLRRWTRKVDIFAHDLMVVPVHLGVHWCLSLVDFREKKISYLDSMGSRNQACLEALKQYLKDEHQDKKGQPFDDSGWKAECLKDIPQQMNGSDCGMFACTFAEFSARNASYSFTQAHMPYLRRKAALEILQGKLLL